MKNIEHFADKSLKEAIAKYEKDLADGADYDWSAWLETPYVDTAKGKFVRGRFYLYDDIEAKIRMMETVTVPGYVLEWKDEKGDWFASEFVPDKSADSNRHDLGEGVSDDWFDNEVEVGFFKELPDAWLGYSDDWDFRLGVAFDAEKTPIEKPSESGVWEGISDGGCGSDGEPWRVRKITIGGGLSDVAKDFIRRNPDVVFKYAA